jgi:hypothetical protein
VPAEQVTPGLVRCARTSRVRYSCAQSS